MLINTAKINVVSEIFREAGQVFFAAVLVSPLVSGSDNFHLILIGLILSLTCWTISIIIQS
jgi:hypothetical protein